MEKELEAGRKIQDGIALGHIASFFKMSRI